MKLFYYNEITNFGDAINPWFWSHYIDQPFQESSDELFVGIGTLLNNRLPKNYKNIHIMGSGAGYGDFVPLCQENWHVYCVRGPLTADVLGIDRKYSIADPAILLNELIPLNSCKDVDCAFMPHVSIDSRRLRTLVEQLGICYISPGDPSGHVIDQVNRSERLICSAMHGAILAEALRVPWYPVTTSPEILHFKWRDWFLSMSIDKNMHLLPTIWPQRKDGIFWELIAGAKEFLFVRELKKIMLKGGFTLAKGHMLEQRKSELKVVFDSFNRKTKIG